MVRRMPQAAVPFEARQRALAAGHGRPLAAPAMNGLRREDPGARAIPARLATVPGPGGTLRPAHPPGLPGKPLAVKPMVPPAGAQGRPGAPGQQLRPGPGGSLLAGLPGANSRGRKA